MTFERFWQIVEAYGAAPARWPGDERAAAQAFAAENPGLCWPVLHEAGKLDAWLAEDRTELAGAALAARIVASAPADHLARPGRRFVWSGLGFAGIGFAGALAGALAVAVLLPAISPPSYDDGDATIVTAFDDVATDMDDQELQ